MRISIVFLLCTVFFTASRLSAQKAHIHINLDRVVKQINDSLRKHTEYHAQVSLLNDSVFIIHHDSATQFRVHVLRLKQKESDVHYFMKGIEFQPMQEGSHVPVSFINFHADRDAFIKFYSVPNTTVLSIYHLFQRMADLMRAYVRPIRGW